MHELKVSIYITIYNIIPSTVIASSKCTTLKHSSLAQCGFIADHGTYSQSRKFAEPYKVR